MEERYDDGELPIKDAGRGDVEGVDVRVRRDTRSEKREIGIVAPAKLEKPMK